MPCHTRQPTSAGLPCHTIVTGGCFQSHRGTLFCYSSILLFFYSLARVTRIVSFHVIVLYAGLGVSLAEPGPGDWTA
jgi:hypothetical protein